MMSLLNKLMKQTLEEIVEETNKGWEEYDKKKERKRISFSQYDAGHIYEYLRFYWEDDFLRHPEDRKMGKFGGCGLCISIGERLEKFIGEEEVKFVEKLARKYRKMYKSNCCKK